MTLLFLDYIYYINKEDVITSHTSNQDSQTLHSRLVYQLLSRKSSFNGRNSILTAQCGAGGARGMDKYK